MRRRRRSRCGGWLCWEGVSVKQGAGLRYSMLLQLCNRQVRRGETAGGLGASIKVAEWRGCLSCSMVAAWDLACSSRQCFHADCATNHSGDGSSSSSSARQQGMSRDRLLASLAGEPAECAGRTAVHACRIRICNACAAIAQASCTMLLWHSSLRRLCTEPAAAPCPFLACSKPPQLLLAPWSARLVPPCLCAHSCCHALLPGTCTYLVRRLPC